MSCFSCSVWSIDVDRNRCSLGGVDIPDHHDCHEQGVGKKNPTNGDLSEAAKEENKSVNRIRQLVERTIAHIKSWRIHPHRLQETPGNIRADDHRSTRTLYLQNHPLNNLPGARASQDTSRLTRGQGAPSPGPADPQEG